MTDEAAGSSQPEKSEPEEKFSRGRVVRFLKENRYGFIKDKNGRDVYFNLDEVRFVGVKDHRELREGLAVGYDVGWTSHGLHVTKIKID
jgi:cold shock CspA family protein